MALTTEAPLTHVLQLEHRKGGHGLIRTEVTVGGAGAEPPVYSRPNRAMNGTGMDKELLAGIPWEGECPKSGWIRLTCPDRHVHWKKTSCKTWRCVVCRRKRKGMVALRVLTGCLILGHCSLTTVTYVMRQASDLRDAGSARRDMRVLWSKWSRKHGKVPWIQVPELTKKGQLHLHLVTKFEEGRQDSCRSDRERYKRWFARNCTESRGLGAPYSDVKEREGLRARECVQHELARLWLDITGDSNVVHVSDIMSPAGAAGYVAKYLAKTLLSNDLEALGYTRRWSRSRDWPGDAEVRLKGTVDSVWRNVDLVPHGSQIKRNLNDRVDQHGDAEERCEYMRPSGNMVSVDAAARQRKLRSAKTVEGIRERGRV